MIPAVRAAFAALLLMSVFAPPAAAQRIVARIAAAAPVSLKPGQFVWYEQPELIKASAAAEGKVSIVVSRSAQQAYVFRGTRLVAVTSVSTGSAGRETPLGQFAILQKKEFHRSNLYSNAPMPFMQRLTWTGIALHAGHLPGYPASHGCIRMPAAFARQLYELTELGGIVSVVDNVYGKPGYYAPPQEPAPLLIAETRDLGGDAYDVVTMRDDASPGVQPVSWERGLTLENVTPQRRGSR